MMNEKRFKIVDEQFISYYGGTGHKISNEECGFWLWHNKIESQEVCDKLNSILDENEQLKQSIDYHLNVCKNEKKKITDLYNWGIPQRHSKSVSSELVLKYIGAIEVLEQIKKELGGDVNEIC